MFLKIKYFVMFALMISFFVFIINQGDPGCKYLKFFYEHKINAPITKIDSFDYETKGFFIHYYFSPNKEEYMFKSTQYRHKYYPDIIIGDSVSKVANTEDFKLYRNDSLVYEAKGYICVCKFCE